MYFIVYELLCLSSDHTTSVRSWAELMYTQSDWCISISMAESSSEHSKGRSNQHIKMHRSDMWISQLCTFFWLGGLDLSCEGELKNEKMILNRCQMMMTDLVLTSVVHDLFSPWAVSCFIHSPSSDVECGNLETFHFLLLFRWLFQVALSLKTFTSSCFWFRCRRRGLCLHSTFSEPFGTDVSTDTAQVGGWCKWIRWWTAEKMCGL